MLPEVIVRYATIFNKGTNSEEYWLARETIIEGVRMDWENVAKFENKKEWEAFSLYLDRLRRNDH